MTQQARETPILHAVRDALAATGKLMLVRNNCGVDLARGVRYGLGVGSPDLVGILRPTGRMACFKVKSKTGRLSRGQRQWHQAARAAGAFVAVVRSPEAALEALARAECGASE